MANGAPEREYAMSWSVNGVDCATSYGESVLFGPSVEDEAITFAEWLLRGLHRDGFNRLTIMPVRRG